MSLARRQPLPIFDAVAALIPEQVLISTDAEGRVRIWSRGAERLYGYAASEMMGHPITDLVPPDRLAEREEKLVAPVLAGETVMLDTVRLHRDGSPLEVHCVSFPLFDGDGEIVGISSVSYHKPELLARDVPLRALVEALPAPALYREDGAFYFNDATAELIGYSRTEIETLDAWFEMLYGAEAQAQKALYDEDRSAGGGAPRTVLLTRKDGRQRFVEVVGYLSPRAEVWLLRDVTARRELEQALIEVSEREQRRIGRDLHDGLGAHLTAVAMLCRTLARRAENAKPVTAAALAEVADLVQEGIATARSLARGLNPVNIESAGLAGALQELAHRVEAHAAVRCRLVVDQPAPVFTEEVATHLYRIAQEACSNAIKHSGTDEVTIGLARSAEGVTLSVEDQGAGLPPDAEARGGLGLHAMRYRANFVGAVLEVERPLRGGTIISCTLSGQ